MLPVQTERTEELQAELWELAQLYLGRAREAQFTQPELLEKAASCLMTVLERDPAHLDSLLGLAYIAALSGLFSWAQDLIQQADRLYSHDPRPAQLAKEIQQIAQRVPEAGQPEDGLLGSLIADIDFNAIPAEFLAAQSQKLAEIGEKA